MDVKNSGGSSCVMSGVCQGGRVERFRHGSTRQIGTVDIAIAMLVDSQDDGLAVRLKIKP